MSQNITVSKHKRHIQLNTGGWSSQHHGTWVWMGALRATRINRKLRSPNQTYGHLDSLYARPAASTVA